MTITAEPAERSGARSVGLLGLGGGKVRGRPAGPVDRLPAVGRRRRPVQAAAGALLLLVCAVVGAQLALRGQPETAVVTVTRPVAAGAALTAADLGIARLSGGGVHAFDASSISSLVGRRAAVALPPGTLLSNAVLTDSTVPAPGQQVLAMALKAGAFPPGLESGQAVAVLQVPPAAGATGFTPEVLAGRAGVVSVTVDSSTGMTVVAVALDNARVLDVARAAAAGAVTLTALPTS